VLAVDAAFEHLLDSRTPGAVVDNVPEAASAAQFVVQLVELFNALVSESDELDAERAFPYVFARCFFCEVEYEVVHQVCHSIRPNTVGKHEQSRWRPAIILPILDNISQDGEHVGLELITLGGVRSCGI